LFGPRGTGKSTWLRKQYPKALVKNLKIRMLPIVNDAPEPKEILRAYAGIYPKEEVQMKDFPMATPILLYRGKQRYREKNILCWPVEDFLKSIDPRSPFPET